MPEAQNNNGPGAAREQKLGARALWPPILWFLAIWIVSSLPGTHLPAPKIVSFDKLGHVGVYLILGLLTNRAVRMMRGGKNVIWWIYLILLVSAGLDELHQYLIPQRSVSLWDFIANAAGLGLAFGTYWIKRDRS